MRGSTHFNPYRHGGETPPSEYFAVYPLNELSGDAVDMVNSYNGVVYNVNRDGSKYIFNGASSYVEIPHYDDFSFIDGVGFEIEMDITFNTLNGSLQWIFSKRQTTSLNEYQLLINGSNELQIQIFEAGGQSNSIGRKVISSEITTGTEYNLKVSYDGSGNRSGISIFLDGVRKDTINWNNASITGMANTGSITTIGRGDFSQSYYFNGAIRNLKLKRVL